MSDSTAPARDIGPLPLVVGVTGHRDLRAEDVETLEAEVRGVFDHLRTRYPATPLVLLSALAEGADRLVARVALAIGIRLVVPLPMSQDRYERDFATPESLAEFRELLARAELRVEMTTARDIPESDPGYTLAGAYIARNSQILIALWDGADSPKAGGTAHVVRFKLKGIPEPFDSCLKRTALPAVPAPDLDDPIEGGPVYQILTPRISNPDPTSREPTLDQVIYPEGFKDHEAARVAFDRIYTRMDTFNRDCLRASTEPGAGSETRASLAFEPNEAPLSARLRSISDHFTTADALAIEYRSSTLRTLRRLFLIIFLGALLFDCYAHVHALQTPTMMAGYLLVLAVAYGCYLGAKRGDYQNKYQDYRALAEGLRVQWYWRLVGLDDSVEDVYLSKQRSELDWIRHAIRAWSVLEGRPPGATPSVASDGQEARIAFLQENWLGRQHRYFANAARREHEQLKRIERIASVAVLSGLALAIASAFSRHSLGEAGLSLVLVAATMLPVAGALIQGYAEKRALAVHIKHYERMSVLFATARSRLGELASAGDHAAARSLIGQIGKEALAENGDWVLLHRERPLEVPKAG